MSIESLFSGMQISASGLSAQRRRMDLIANNIANANTTRTAEGGPYKRMDVDFVAQVDPQTGMDSGVDISDVYVDPTAPRMVYDPGHPDANKDGFVAYPNVNMITEMVNMTQVVRAYEANVTALNAAKDMINKSFEIAAVS